MKNFLLKCLLHTVLITASIVAIQFGMGMLYHNKANKDFVHTQAQDILFLGSSQIGCAVDTSAQYHNKVIWSSERPMESVLARAHYLEDHGFLDGIKVMVVRLNRFGLYIESSNNMQKAWYAELPINSGYWNLYQQSYYDLLKHAATHLRIPPPWHVVSSRILNKKSISEQSKEWKDNFYSIVTQEDNDLEEQIREAVPRLTRIYSELKSICDRHDIRFVAVEFPGLKSLTNTHKERDMRYVEDLIDKVKANGIEVVRINDEYGEDYFFDHAHMTESGAARFTAELYQLLHLHLKPSPSPEPFT